MNRDTLSRPHILIIDDVPDNVEILGTVLTADYEVRFATSGQEGLELARRFPTDLILLDVMMPEMDGYETFRRLHQDAALAKIPVIFVTAMSEAEAEIAGLALGAADYISKPININIARLRIRNQIEQQMLKCKLALSLDASRQCFWELDLINDHLQYEDAMLGLLGLPADNAPHSMQAWLARIHPDDRAVFMDNLQSALQPGDPIFNLEYRIEQEAGQWGWLQTHGRVVRRGVGGVPELAVGTSIDITERKDLQETLREQKQEFDLILNNSSVGISFIKERRLVWANRRMSELFGYTPEEMENRSTATFYTSQSAHEKLGQEAYPALMRGERYTAEQEMLHKDGSHVWMRISGQSTSDDHSIGGSIWVFEDITERKQNEAELAQHRHHLEELVQQRSAALLEMEARASHILNSSADGLFGSDPAGIITFINPAACAMLGYSAEQLVGQAAHAAFHHSKADGTPYPAEQCPTRNALQLGHKVRVDHEVYWHADGHAIPVMYASHPMLENGVITGEVTSFVDVTEQRAAAQARERALIAAENLARMRSDFLANISHELRTPLNGVLGFADIGYRNAQNPEKARDAFSKIKTSGNRLLGVITDLLDFSSIDAGKLDIEQTEVSLGAVVDHAIEVIRDRAAAKRLALRVELAPDLPPRCIGDPLRMGRVLSHLLSNAVKFTEAGSVTLSVARQGEQLLFRVVDSGIGMSAEQLGHLFNPFQQADASATRKFGGAGLGLAISKRMVELMRGDLRVESQPGVGTSVEFRLPYVFCELSSPDIS